VGNLTIKYLSAIRALTPFDGWLLFFQSTAAVSFGGITLLA
jgi:hypothetical protein